MATITIKINNSANARPLELANLIHAREFQVVESWVDELTEKSYLKDNNEGHEAITLLGTRGSGKTTFLMSLLNVLQRKKNLEVLKFVDPTIIEEKGHIFLDIVSRIKEEIDKRYHYSGVEINQERYEERKKWDKLLKNLAHGIPHLDGVGGQMTEPSWQDAEFIMRNGLLGVEAARNLRQNFEKFLNFSLDLLDKRMLIIAFDDVDIDFRKGWTVLETVRKYFTSNRMVIMLSGDMKLYSKAIRKNQWKNFGKALLINEAEQQAKLAYYNDLVTTMEGQYMQKVMRPERRIHLPTIGEKILNGGDATGCD